MESSKNTSSMFYQEQFNPMSHLAFLTDCVMEDKEGAEVGRVVFIHEFMKTGVIRGKDLLEVGCGPSVLFSIVPSQYYENVYLADYLQQNVDIIQTWIDNTPGQVDFQPSFDFAGRHLGKGSSWHDGPAELRKKIRGVWRCDVHHPEVLPSDIKPKTFDCITSSYVLQAACRSDDELNKAVLHLASLLNPGGFLITYGAFQATYFTVDDIKYPDYPITEASLSLAIRNAGLHLVYKRCQDLHLDKSVGDAKSYGIYVAKK